MTNGLIKPYPDEPHPNDEHAWKSWWVKKCFDLDEPLTAGALKWIDQCWSQTKAAWCASGGKEQQLEAFLRPTQQPAISTPSSC